MLNHLEKVKGSEHPQALPIFPKLMNILHHLRHHLLPKHLKVFRKLLPTFHNHLLPNRYHQLLVLVTKNLHLLMLVIKKPMNNFYLYIYFFNLWFFYFFFFLYFFDFMFFFSFFLFIFFFIFIFYFHIFLFFLFIFKILFCIFILYYYFLLNILFNFDLFFRMIINNI